MRISEAPIQNVQVRNLNTVPAAPAAGYERLYVRQNVLYRLNTGNEESGVGFAGDVAGAQVSMTVPFAMDDNTYYLANYDTLHWDEGLYTDLEFNPPVIAIPRAGLYLTTLSAEFGPLVGDAELRLMLNYTLFRFLIKPASTTIGITLQIVEILSLPLGSLISAEVGQFTGGNGIMMNRVTLGCQRLTGAVGG